LFFYAVIYRDDIESDESFEETTNIEKMKFVVNLVACKRNILQIWKSLTKDFYENIEKMKLVVNSVA